MDSSNIKRNSGGGVDAAGASMLLVKDAGEIARERAIVREVGTLLIVSGIAGILLPGPVGTPLLILGCVLVWPKSFERINVYFSNRFPRAHHLGVLQSTRFLTDLERRYPVSK